MLVVIRKSRGKNVIEEILGTGPEGVNGSDGWRAYSWMKLQRCWAHLLRQVDDFIDVSENGKRFSEDIHSCFKKLREHVIMRKIIGCFRSEKGAENYQYIASLLATARLQGKNGFEVLEKVLRQELCLS